MGIRRRISIITVIAIIITSTFVDGYPVSAAEIDTLLEEEELSTKEVMGDITSEQLLEESADEGCLETESVLVEEQKSLLEDYSKLSDSDSNIEVENDRDGNTGTISKNGFWFEISYADNEATVKSWEGEGVAEIPSSIMADKTYPVTTIGSNAFKDNQDTLTGVIIPSSVTKIDSSAFKDCTKLLRVELPTNMVLLNDLVFDGCTSLNYVKLPEKLNEMGNYLFKDCLSLDRITIPKNMELKMLHVDERRFDAGPFTGAVNLKNIEFEPGFDTVPDKLFTRCDSIEQLVFPAEVTQIGNNAFRSCGNLKKITMSNSVRKIGAAAFYDCTSLESLNLSQILNSLGDWAFGACTTLSQCTIPDSIDNIGTSAFQDCTSLEKVTFVTGDTAGSKNGVICANAFAGCTSLKDIVIPNSFKSIGNSAFEGCTSLVSLVHEKRFNDILFDISIGNRAFFGCTALEKVEFKEDEHLKTIGGLAFYNCNKLEEVVLPDCVEVLGNQAFEQCISLNNVVLSKKLSTLGAAAFRGDSEINTIEIPKSVVTVPVTRKEDGVFRDCTKLKNVKFENGITKIPANLLWGTDSIKDIVINEGVNDIGANAFRECIYLENVKIPGSVVTIGDAAFYECKNIVCPLNGSGLIPEGVKTIGSYSFGGCKRLSTNYLPDGLESIGSFAFSNCTGISKASIPNSVTSIGSSCFEGCENLTEIHLPDELSVVPDGMFKDCKALVKVNLSKEKLSSIGVSAFNNCNSLVSFDDSQTIDFSDFKTLKEIKANAFQECDKIKAVKLSAATKNIGECVFDHCQMLSDISLGTGLSTIPAYAFSNLNSLVEMIIPRNVKIIKTAAFEYDPNFAKIQISKETELERGAFSVLDKLTIWGVEGSPAHKYAIDEKIAWHTKEVYVDSINYLEDEIVININEVNEPVLEVLPVHYTVDITYKSDNENIFTVDANGKIKGIASGIAKLKATASANELGEHKSDTVIIRVKVPVTGVGIRGIVNKDKINIGEKRKLEAVVAPDNATDKTVTWSSSDESVVYVDAKGTLYAKDKGSAVVTLTSNDNPNIKAYYEVEVISNMVEAPPKWTKSLNAPMSDHNSGTVNRGTRIKLSCIEPGADIYYTVDGSDPVADYTGKTSGSTRLYTGDIIINKNTTIKAFAICPGYQYSNKAEYIYTVFDIDAWGDVDSTLRGLFGNDPEKVPDGIWYAFDGDDIYYTEAKDTKITKTYTSEKITFDGEIHVFHGNSRLVQTRDYKVSYANNIKIAPVTDVNAPSFTITGKGNYSDKKVFKFAITENTDPIEQSNISEKDLTIKNLNTKPYYTGSQISLDDIGYNELTLSYKGTQLEKDTDYTVDMCNATAYGKFNLIFRFKGKYTGSVAKKIKVQKYDLKSDPNKKVEISVDSSPIYFTKAGATPGVLVTYGKIKLKEGVDYKLNYSKNKAVTTKKKAIVKVVGKGCFKGSVSNEFEILKAPASNVKLVVDDVKYVDGQAAKKYLIKASKIKLMQDGKNVKSSFDKLKDADLKFYNAISQEEINENELLKEYTVIEVRATLKAKSNGPFEGTSDAIGTYRIIPADKNIKSATITIKDSYFDQGEELVPLKSSDIVVNHGNATLPASEYEIVWITKNRFVGSGKVTIAGRNQYGGTKTKTFKIKKKTL